MFIECCHGCKTIKLYRTKYRYKPAGGLLAGFLYFPTFLYSRHISRRVKLPEPPEGRCTIYTNDTGLHCTICTISNFSDYFHFLQIRLNCFNFHIFPAILYPNEAINRCKKSSRTCDLTIFYIFSSNIQYILWLGAKKIELDFLMCTCAD